MNNAFDHIKMQALTAAERKELYAHCDDWLGCFTLTDPVAVILRMSKPKSESAEQREQRIYETVLYLLDQLESPNYGRRIKVKMILTEMNRAIEGE